MQLVKKSQQKKGNAKWQKKREKKNFRQKVKKSQRMWESTRSEKSPSSET